MLLCPSVRVLISYLPSAYRETIGRNYQINAT